jgi:3-oxoacyl-[acyl-carrier protein] reductase
MIEFTGRRALVTGAGVGIGAGIALALARAGADVVVHYRGSHSEAEVIAGEIRALGRRSTALPADLIDADAATGLVTAAAAFLGGIDIVVNNAGHLVARAPIAEMSNELWHRILDVNVSTAFHVSRAAAPHLAASPFGRLVLMSSLAAENGGGAGAVAYAASKSAVIGLTRGLAKELASAGVTVNAVAPGFIEGTPFHDTFTADTVRPGIVAGIPLGRAGTVADVAGVVAFLASDLAAFVTGQVVDVNGGVHFR